MAIANGTCVSFCNQPKAHYLATSRESHRYVVAISRLADAGIWLRQESLRYILTSPGYAPGTIAANVTWIKREFNASTPRSMYPSIFNHFPVIQAVNLKVRHFSTFFAHFRLPWDNRGRCYMDRKRIQCWSNASQHVPIYLQPFLRYSDISVASDWFSTVSWSEWAFFTTFWFPLVTTLGIQCLSNASQHVYCTHLSSIFNRSKYHRVGKRIQYL